MSSLMLTFRYFTRPEHLNSPSVFSEVRVSRFFVLCECFVDRACPLYFIFWLLCFLFFFDIRILITPYVSFKLFL